MSIKYVLKQPGPVGAGEGRPTKRKMKLFIPFVDHYLTKNWPKSSKLSAFQRETAQNARFWKNRIFDPPTGAVMIPKLWNFLAPKSHTTISMQIFLLRKVSFIKNVNKMSALCFVWLKYGIFPYSNPGFYWK
jgi:hypothetical protein